MAYRLRLSHEESALLTLLRSMSFDLPRAELCCEIGKYFLEHGSFYHAIYWYETALQTYFSVADSDIRI